MLFKIDYTTRNERRVGEKWVDHVADRTEAVKLFMDDFFSEHPEDAVRIENVMEVSVVGDMSHADDVIDILRGRERQ